MQIEQAASLDADDIEVRIRQLQTQTTPEAVELVISGFGVDLDAKKL
jgi:hypothetical protein